MIQSRKLGTANHTRVPDQQGPDDARDRGNPEPDALMDVRGLAEYLRLDRQTIYNWLHQHKIAGIKVGGVWRFERRVIEAWLREQTVQAQALRQAQQRHEELHAEG